MCFASGFCPPPADPNIFQSKISHACVCRRIAPSSFILALFEFAVIIAFHEEVVPDGGTRRHVTIQMWDGSTRFGHTVKSQDVFWFGSAPPLFLRRQVRRRHLSVVDGAVRPQFHYFIMDMCCVHHVGAHQANHPAGHVQRHKLVQLSQNRFNLSFRPSPEIQ